MAVTQIQDQDSLAKEVADLGRDIDTLRTQYDQYFQGVIREEPFALREKVMAIVRRLSTVTAQNARVKFLLQQTIAKYNTYTTYWNRILREIEEGRYKNHLFQARLRQRDPETPQTNSNSSAEPTHTLFQAYMKTKARCGEAVTGLTFEQFEKGLAQQRQLLQQRFPGKNIAFRVVVENDKAKLKAFEDESG